VTDAELITEIETQRGLMAAVATGGPKIQQVNKEYIDRRDIIRAELHRRKIADPNPHGDLWAWYGRWTSGDMPSWGDRRAYCFNLYQDLLDRIKQANMAEREPTGWPRVDRGIDEIRLRLRQAETEEQCQAVGLLCREAMISLAQLVYDPERHPNIDGVDPSKTDAKRMLDNYFATELPGGANEGIRRHAKAALSLANDLQHNRTASRREAALCAEATASVVNIVAIVSGRRDE
jgi:hypothetical protein